MYCSAHLIYENEKRLVLSMTLVFSQIKSKNSLILKYQQSHSRYQRKVNYKSSLFSSRNYDLHALTSGCVQWFNFILRATEIQRFGCEYEFSTDHNILYDPENTDTTQNILDLCGSSMTSGSTCPPFSIVQPLDPTPNVREPLTRPNSLKRSNKIFL